MRRSVLPIVLVALGVIVGLSYLVGQLRTPSNGEASPTANPTAAATATAESTNGETTTTSQTSEQVAKQEDEIIGIVRTFVSDYYGYVPGNQWADIRGKVQTITSARFLAGSRPDDYLPVDDLELDRELRHDVEAVLDTMVSEYDDLEIGPVAVSTSLGVTSYTPEDQIDSYSVLNRVLVVELRRSGTDAWVVDDISFIE